MIAYTWGQSYGFSELRDNYARFGEDLRYTLMPNMDNGKNVFRATDLLGINTTAADKEIAWQFLMAFIKSSSQNGMPMDRTVMQGWVDRLLNPTDEDKMHYNGTIMVDGKKRQAHMLTKEWIEGFVAVIESLNATVSYDNTASEILRKEMKPFYEDKKTIEDVIPIIQNHMSTYVNE